MLDSAWFDADDWDSGPAYLDDTIAARRDLNRDGDFEDANEGFLYYLTGQQYSTVALLDETGAVVERYGYDAFGVPAFYDGNGTVISDSAVGNHRLYNGRDYMPALGLYDYRQRLYDPALGRFLSTDPAYDPANLGNPYTYVGNNPGAFVDPYGEWRWDADYIQYGLGGLCGFHGSTVMGATWSGAGTGVLEGATVMGDYASFGMTPIHADAARIQQNAAQTGDWMSQVGFGAGKAGIEAAYLLAGGYAGKGIGAAARGFIGAEQLEVLAARHSRKIIKLAQVGAIAASGAAGWNAGSTVDAAIQGDWQTATHNAGQAAMSCGVARSALQFTEGFAAKFKRLPQDINVNPEAPSPKSLRRTIGPSPTQNAAMQYDIREAKSKGAINFRVNQQQVNEIGKRVGINVPDLQYSLKGQRVYVEYDTFGSNRGPIHRLRLIMNDPEGTVILKKID